MQPYGNPSASSMISWIVIVLKQRQKSIRFIEELRWFKIVIKIPIEPFCSNEWTNPKNHVHSSLLNNLHKLDKIIPPLKIILWLPKWNRGDSKLHFLVCRCCTIRCNKGDSHCPEKVHGHSRTHKTRLHQLLLPWLSESVPATSAHHVNKFYTHNW